MESPSSGQFTANLRDAHVYAAFLSAIGDAQVHLELRIAEFEPILAEDEPGDMAQFGVIRSRLCRANLARTQVATACVTVRRRAVVCSEGERRRSHRPTVALAATISFETASDTVSLRNLSSSGALVEGEVLPPAGSIIQFKRNDLSRQACVVWSRGSR
jgi:hypothetical protein